MTRKVISVLETVFEHVKTYDASTNLVTVTIVATTDEGASPPSGGKWLHVGSSGATVMCQDLPAYSGSPARCDIVHRGLRVEGTITDASKELIRWGTYRVFRERVDDSTFTIKVTSGGTVTGSIQINTSQTFTVALAYDGANVTLYIDGVQDAQAANTTKLDSRAVAVFGTQTEAGVIHYYDYAASFEGDADDQPDTDVGVYLLNPNANTSEDDYSDQADCSAGAAGAGDFARWDDYPGTPDDATTYNCAGARNAQQTSGLSTASPSGDIAGAIYRIWNEATTGTKTVDNWARLIEGANVSEVQLVNIGHDSFKTDMLVYPDPPDGGAWTQAIVDALEAGHRVVSTNGAGANVSALGVAIVSVSDLPAAIRTGVALGSGNMMVV